MSLEDYCKKDSGFSLILLEIKNIIFESKHFDGTFTEGKKLQEVKKNLISNGYNLKQLDEENILATKQ